MELILKSPKYGEKIVLFDDEDYELVSQINWKIVKSKEIDTSDVFYARGIVPKKIFDKYGQNSVRMHRIIMSAKKEEQIDHINHNGLDNRKANLRIATNSQQTANTRLQARSTTGFKGVTFKSKKKLYISRIRIDGKLIGGGLFKNKYQAALKYNEMAIKYFGEYACINQLTEDEIKLAKEYIPNRIYKTNKTGYMGVSISKQNLKKKYMSTIWFGNKNVHLGFFEYPKDAAIAYNTFIIENNMDLRRLNIIPNE